MVPAVLEMASSCGEGEAFDWTALRHALTMQDPLFLDLTSIACACIARLRVRPKEAGTWHGRCRPARLGRKRRRSSCHNICKETAQSRSQSRDSHLTSIALCCCSIRPSPSSTSRRLLRSSRRVSNETHAASGGSWWKQGRQAGRQAYHTASVR